MIPAAFEYVRATSLDQAIGLLQQDSDGHKIVAGGHTLIPTLKLRLATPNMLVDVRDLDELKGIGIGEQIRIGALTTHAQLLASEPLHDVLPIFRQAANIIADPQVRNRGTIGGSLANADPAADWPAVVLALRAELDLAGPNGRRRVAATDFFIDIFTTTLAAGEMIVGIHIPRPKPGSQFRYRKIRHPASGYAVVGVAVQLQLIEGIVQDAVIGITGAASCAFAAKAAAEFLIGKPLSAENIKQASELTLQARTCLSDRYASADYRQHLVHTETGRALLSLSSAA
jgi:aerobic carbon-monoxide dehydrogenase medium subunit